MTAQFDENGNIIIPKTMKFNELGQPEETIYTFAKMCVAGCKNVKHNCAYNCTAKSE